MDGLLECQYLIQRKDFFFFLNGKKQYIDKKKSKGLPQRVHIQEEQKGGKNIPSSTKRKFLGKAIRLIQEEPNKREVHILSGSSPDEQRPNEIKFYSMNRVLKA